MAPGFIPEGAYKHVLDSTVIVCADVVIIDRSTRRIWLAHRRQEPMSGLWWIGGRVLAGETPEDAARRKFLNETGVSLEEHSLKLITLNDYVWATREQQPQDAGCHDLVFTFALDVTPQIIGDIQLKETEYAEGGLTPYSRKQLVNAGAHLAIIDFYDEVFPSLWKRLMRACVAFKNALTQ